MRSLKYTRSPSRPSYSPRPSYSSNRRTTPPAYYGSRSKQAAFFYRFPIMYYPAYMYYQRDSLPKGCDTDRMVLHFGNGTRLENSTEIQYWFQRVNETEMNDVKLSLPCEKMNMASILGISLGIGIPVCLVLLCCLCHSLSSVNSTRSLRSYEMKEIKSSKAIKEIIVQQKEHPILEKPSKTIPKEIIIEQKEPKKRIEPIIQKPSNIIPKEIIIEQKEPKKRIEPIIQKPYIRRKTNYYEEFIQNSSYSRHIAHILDFDMLTIPIVTMDWLQYSQPELHSQLKMFQKERMADDKVAKIAVEELLKSVCVTKEERNKLAKYYVLFRDMLLRECEYS